MKTLKIQSKKVAAKYIARKKKVNTRIKGQDFDARILVNKSINYVTAQVMTKDGTILAFISDKGLNGDTKTQRANSAGKALAAKISSLKNINKLVFDRNGHLYHGRVKSLAEGLREGGVKI